MLETSCHPLENYVQTNRGIFLRQHLSNSERTDRVNVKVTKVSLSAECTDSKLKLISLVFIKSGAHNKKESLT